jgi:heat shock protein HslJ
MGRYLIILLFLFAACKPSESITEGKDATLESSSWTLREMNGVEVKVTEGGQQPFVNFTDGQNVINGSGGCNSMNGMYTVHDHLIKLHKMTQTERACMDERLNKMENDFFNVLESATTYKIKKKTINGNKKQWLELYLDDQKIAAFESDSIRRK